MPKTDVMEPAFPRASADAPIRVLIADDDVNVVEVLARIIRAEHDMEVVAVGHDARQAVDLAARYHPDVALIDVCMEGGGPWATRSIRRTSPRSEILAFSAHDDRAH